MALETFTWCTQVQNNGGAGSVSDNVRGIQFGNGFRQLATSGLNTIRREFNIVYAGKSWEDVYNFMTRHTYKPFIWRAPDGKLGVFTVKSGSIATRPLKMGMLEVTCQVSEEFTSAR